MHPVSLNDCDLLLAWRNSPAAKEVSRLGQHLNEVDHRDWFNSRIARTASEPFWIMSILDEEIGYVRLDRVDGQEDLYAVSIFVAPKYQAAGNGKKMLKLALASAISDNSVLNFQAVIKKSNLESIALFKKFGFKFRNEVDSDYEEYQVTADEIRMYADSI